MKWVLVGIAILACIGGAVAVVGAMLPITHSATVSMRLDQPADVVWQVVADIGGWPTWNPAVTSAEAGNASSGKTTWVVVDANGRITSEVLESSAPSNGAAGRLVTRIADPDLPYGGTWTWTVTPTYDGCAVSIREDGEIYNVVFRFMARYVFGYTATAETYLQALGRKFGDDVSPAAG